MNDGNRLLPPLCLVLALVSLICGFALLAKGAPEPGIDLHQARLLDDEDRKTALEARLKRDRWIHHGLTGGLFVFSAVFAATGFLSMKPAEG